RSDSKESLMSTPFLLGCVKFPALGNGPRNTWRCEGSQSRTPFHPVTLVSCMQRIWKPRMNWNGVRKRGGRGEPMQRCISGPCRAAGPWSLRRPGYQERRFCRDMERTMSTTAESEALVGVELRPIGVIRSALKTRKEAPKQGSEGAPDG